VLPLTIALGNSGLSKTLKDTGAPSPRLQVKHIPVDPIVAAMRRMVRGLEFDVCELALSTYLCARRYEKPITAIPVFLTRNFHHRAIFRNVHSGIQSPKDLEGKTVGVLRGYTVTTGLWARGILHSEYGVDLDKITWAATGEEHVAEFQAPANVNYSYRGRDIVELLLSREMDAAIGDLRTDSPDIQPLIPDARNAAFAYFRKTGVYPINHVVAIKTAILNAEPWVAEELFSIFKAAKGAYLQRLQVGKELSPADEAVLSVSRVVGDPVPLGVEANRKTLETIIQFAVEQRIIPQKVNPEDLFAPNTLALA